MHVTRVIKDEQQINAIKNSIQLRLPLIKDIYNYLQAKSDSYPLVDKKAFMKYFVSEMNSSSKNLLSSATITNVILETCV